MTSVPSTASRILKAAIRGLARYEQGGLSIDDYLDFELDIPEQRRTVGGILFSSFRYRARLERTLAALTRTPPRPRLRRLLLSVLCQVFHSRGIAAESAVNVAVELAGEQGGPREAGFVNAVLRQACRTAGSDRDPPGPGDLPPVLLERWRRHFSEDILQQFAELLHSVPGGTFRCRLGAELSVAESDELGAEALPPALDGSPWSFYQINDWGRLFGSAGWREGRFYIQDPAAAAVLSLGGAVRPERALDLCAAPGGKSLLIAELLPETGQLWAADRSASRQELTRENFRRWQLDPERHRILVGSPWELAPELKDFDLVLADVPCSNTGVFRRRPDALWRFSETSLRQVSELQQQILAAAAARVKAGGRLLYSTCSIEPEENDWQIAGFLREHPEFKLEDECRILPGPKRDGAYGCRLRKVAVRL